jgi:hypothetical protein
MQRLGNVGQGINRSSSLAPIVGRLAKNVTENALVSAALPTRQPTNVYIYRAWKEKGDIREVRMQQPASKMVKYQFVHSVDTTEHAIRPRNHPRV